jgi:hypothetical protein
LNAIHHDCKYQSHHQALIVIRLTSPHQWPPAKSAGLAFGIILPILITITGVLVYHRHKRTHNSPAKSDPGDIELDPKLALVEPTHQSQPVATDKEPTVTVLQPEHIHAYTTEDNEPKPELPQRGPTDTSTSETDPTLPNPLHEGGTVRRQTGHPQTFHDWVLTSNEATSTKREPFPYLMGPVDTSSVSSKSQGGETTAPVSRPGTGRESWGGSSLMEVVLGAAEPPAGTGLNKQVTEESQDTVVEEAKEKEEAKESKKVEEKEVSKGYSGAWP